MYWNVSEELQYARIKFFIKIAKENKGRLTPEVFLKAVGGNTRLVNQILCLARHSGYVKVENVRDGRRVVYWAVKVTGKVPSFKGREVSPITPSRGRKPLKGSAMTNATRQKKYRDKKASEQIKTENLEKMKALTTKRKTKKTIVIDEVDVNENGSTYKIDPAWDSTDGLDIKKLVA